MSDEGSIELPVHRWTEGAGLEKMTDSIAVERTLAIGVAGTVVARLQCLPIDIEDLAVGFLVSNGLAAEPASVGAVAVSDDAGCVDVEVEGMDSEAAASFGSSLALASGCGKALFAPQVAERFKRAASPGVGFTAEQIRAAVKDLSRRGEVFERTGAVHAAGAWRGGDCVAYREDIARHNAIDKVAGSVIRSGGDLGGSLLVSTGRLTAEVVAKAIRLRAWGVASRSAATDRAIMMAAEFGLVLVGFVRGRRMNVYCGVGSVST
jgi:FdhD protein